MPRLVAKCHLDGEVEALYVRFSQDELPRHVVLGMMRIVQIAHPATTVVFVDVPRLVSPTTHGRDLTLCGEWLTEAGNDLAQLQLFARPASPGLTGGLPYSCTTSPLPRPGLCMAVRPLRSLGFQRLGGTVGCWAAHGSPPA